MIIKYLVNYQDHHRVYAFHQNFDSYPPPPPLFLFPSSFLFIKTTIHTIQILNKNNFITAAFIHLKVKH